MYSFINQSKKPVNASEQANHPTNHPAKLKRNYMTYTVPAEIGTRTSQLYTELVVVPKTVPQ